MRFLDALALAVEPNPERKALIRRNLQTKALAVPKTAWGQSLQLGQLLAPHYRAKPLWTAWDAEKAIREGYRGSVYVFRAINAMATAVGGVPWTVWRRKEAPIRTSARRRLRPEDEWEQLAGHPIELLFETPNPEMARKDLFERQVQQHWLTGNSLIFIGDLTDQLPPPIVYGTTQTPGMPLPGWSNLLPAQRVATEDRRLLRFPTDKFAHGEVELWPLSSVGFKPVPDDEGMLRWYRYEANGIITDFPAETIIHFQFADPANPFWGMSPLEAIDRQLDMDQQALEWNTSMMERGVGLSGWLTYKGGQLLGEDYAEARRLADETLAGVAGAGATGVSGEGWEYKDLNRSPKEMDFNQSRDRVREEVLSLFGMPPPVAGFFENATLANAEVSRKMWWLDAVLPYLENLRSVYERKLLPLFAEEGEELWLRYDTTGVSALREDISAKIGNMDRLLAIGVPFNEAKAIVELDIDDIEGLGDVPFGVLKLKERASVAVPPQPASTTPPVAQPLPSEEPVEEGWNVQPPRPAVGAGYRIKLHRKHEEKQEVAFETLVPGIDALVRDYEQRMAEKVLEIITAVRESVDLPSLAAALAAGASHEVLDLLGLDELEAGLKMLVEEYAEAAAEAGDQIASELPGARGFDTSRAEAAALVRMRTLASDLVASNREGVLEAVTAWNGGSLGDDPSGAAEAFAALVGLNSRQAAQVVGLWAAQVGWDEDAGQYTGLDKAVRKAKQLGLGLAEDRAIMIGQAEAAGAINGGQIEAWRQLERDGVVTDVRKQWVKSPESPDVCPVCIDLDEQEVDIDAQFHSAVSGEDYDQPTAHPHCYCGVLVTAEVVE